jgi:hypothetical protein
MPYVVKFGRVASAAALALGMTANANATSALEWTESILGDPNVLSTTFNIDSLIDHTVSLVDNAFLADFDRLELLITRTGNGTMTTLSGPGSTTFTPISVGSYTATVFGDPGDSSGVSLSTFGVTVAAVPEAETWAMMLVGMGLVGWQLRRKVKASAASRFV